MTAISQSLLTPTTLNWPRVDFEQVNRLYSAIHTYFISKNGTPFGQSCHSVRVKKSIMKRLLATNRGHHQLFTELRFLILYHLKYVKALIPSQNVSKLKEIKGLLKTGVCFPMQKVFCTPPTSLATRMTHLVIRALRAVVAHWFLCARTNP